eukprot:TRINITY_DN44760_c0_g1_i1.p1 TRINITY_DN44760_c0_g1~~TRINITY_DN44760_c0_g1_i1.p1  ORF type:complete len:684 (+),score=90.92 TRINITY_DN44760_c0_g1_i1:99-2150(+)
MQAPLLQGSVNDGQTDVPVAAVVHSHTTIPPSITASPVLISDEKTASQLGRQSSSPCHSPRAQDIIESPFDACNLRFLMDQPTTFSHALVCAEDLTPADDDSGRFGNVYFRFSILFAVLVVGIALCPLLVALCHLADADSIPSEAVAYTQIGFQIMFALLWTIITVCAVRNFLRMSYLPAPTNFWAAKRGRRFRHIVVVTFYLDSMDILKMCLATLALQQDPSILTVVVTFEARTPDLDAKMAMLRSWPAGRRFHELLAVVHTLDPLTEIPGACSNRAFALRRAWDHVLRNHTDAAAHRYTITTVDPDTKLHPCYFETLEVCYNAQNPSCGPPRPCVWQAPLFYQWNIADRWAFVRVTGVVRSLAMLGTLISWNLNPMSAFSVPAEVACRSGFVNPRYSVDDIIQTARMQCALRSDVPVRLLPVPVISGPTAGATLGTEIYEWARQLRRWAAGAAEAFHYFICHWRGRPAGGGMWLIGFFVYYGIFLSASATATIAASIPYPWVQYPTVEFTRTGSHVTARFNAAAMSSKTPVLTDPDDVRVVSLLTLANCAALLVLYVCIGTALLIDTRASRRMRIRGQELVPWWRTLVHLVISPLVVWGMSLVSIYAVVSFVFAGKSFVRHEMASKAALESRSRPVPDEEEPVVPLAMKAGVGGGAGSSAAEDGVTSKAHADAVYAPVGDV